MVSCGHSNYAVQEFLHSCRVSRGEASGPEAGVSNKSITFAPTVKCNTYLESSKKLFNIIYRKKISQKYHSIFVKKFINTNK